MDQENKINFNSYKHILLKQAWRYSKMFPQYDMEELANEAWLRGIDHLTNPKYIKKRIICNILDFVRSDTKYRKKYTLKMIPMTSLVSENTDDDQTIEEMFAKSYIDQSHSTIESDEFIAYLVSITKLSNNERMFFLESYKGTSQIDICNKYKVGEPYVSAVIKKARIKLQKTLLELDDFSSKNII